jgi:hypothetical protein
MLICEVEFISEQIRVTSLAVVDRCFRGAYYIIGFVYQKAVMFVLTAIRTQK